MELTPSLMEAVGWADAATLLQQLYDLGYTDISHSGYGSALNPALICSAVITVVVSESNPSAGLPSPAFA